MTYLDPCLSYRGGQLHIDDVALDSIAAEVGTPAYVYSATAIRAAYRRYVDAFAAAGLPMHVCYAVKANSALAIIKLLADAGAGADVVSGGELARALRAGVAPDLITFAGVGKTAAEIDRALGVGIAAFTVESAQELELIERRAAAVGVVAGVALRVNPDVDAGTHPYITTGRHANKFGVAPAEALRLLRHAHASEHLAARGIHMHIGSQLTRVAPILEAADRVLDLDATLADEGIDLEYLDIGGGLGITYDDEMCEGPAELARGLAEIIGVQPCVYPRVLRILAEPGRYLVGNAGVLLAQVLYTKGSDPTFAIVDAAMNDLIRPALYGAYHAIVPTRAAHNTVQHLYNVVGPVCESGDFLAQERYLPPLAPGDRIAVLSAGAYGASMASTYNSRARPAEILVDGATWRVIRRRETESDLMHGEDV